VQARDEAERARLREPLAIVEPAELTQLLVVQHHGKHDRQRLGTRGLRRALDV
jgi:hypothetical protein